MSSILLFLKLHHDLIQVIYLVENPLVTFLKSFSKFLTVLAVLGFFIIASRLLLL